ncbi:hypothetical protein M409DRAFT_26904 [Zasmidium cellare ATCC 36951]|uniref:UPF3 domain-containing protein n=1 Tax=Zasmidium cellare ATCC 36951 TaxID=1080233 RepID=A0A6A6CB34_ZASCE|nr:uncharacterized protein M409DRAFT_26904 [Zasmidium cellare ATCC 36951]KAF2162666.1 hypothetical protein M409DRAFT_26904 [Zasmidium cellare ATCC 36951]
MPPKVLVKNNDRASGVLPVNAATRAAAIKGPQPRLKLEVRRLPPGLTLTEFEEILGDEWKLGNGKVDWREYRQGKVKTALGKIPEQSRCYVHLVNEQVVKEFEARFLAVTFQDKAGTHKNSDLKNLPPTLGFAPNQRTPINAKPRADTRQGTIDQDPEFIAFLEAETQPITKPPALDSASAEQKEVEKVEVKSTPLIEALREKKANKAKAAESKAEKKESKGHSRNDSKDGAASKKDGKDDKVTPQQKVEQASKEAVKALNKQVAGKQQQNNQRPASPQQPQSKNGAQAKQKKDSKQSPKQQNATPNEPASTAKNAAAGAATAAAQNPTPRGPRQRGNAEGIKKMLQKDLGIKPKPTPATQDKTEKSSPQSPAPSSPAVMNAATNSKDQKPQPSSTPTGPASTANAKVPTGPKQQQTSTPSPSTFKAYLKHANPSQGMTEILIQQALSQYGDVTNVTIEPRKGTAIAIFKDGESMKKAVEAKKVAVANGNVEVLEFKDRNAGSNRGGFRGGRGGARGGRGGGQVAAGNAAQTQAQAPAKAEVASGA